MVAHRQAAGRKVATPPASTGLVPSNVLPSVKETTPVGKPAPGASTVTVAVKMTGARKAAGLGALVSAVAVAALFTVCAAAPAAPVKLPSPP